MSVRARHRRAAIAACFVASTGCGAQALAAEEPPAVSIALRDTADVWGGRGLVALNKLQVSGTLEGRVLGLPGWRFHAQIYRLDGDSLSARVGDIQTASNIDAPDATRLFEAWAERNWGSPDHPVFSLRGGLVDLNADFDAIDPASLFINSSHGIGPDLSRSGLDGPSIYPATALGARVIWSPSDGVSVKAALFDGVAGDPDRPHAFMSERLSARDGVLGIGEVDVKLPASLALDTGFWAYSRVLQPSAAASGAEPGKGVYAGLSSPTPKEAGWAGWLRVGRAEPRAQVVDGYVGAGFIYKGVFGRRDDRIGLAVARASLSRPAQLNLGLPATETSYEASYQMKLGDSFALQPDVQYIVRPAAISGRPSTVVFGLRLIMTGGYPAKAKPKPEDSTDPTVPPDTPAAPADAGSTQR